MVANDRSDACSDGVVQASDGVSGQSGALLFGCGDRRGYEQASCKNNRNMLKANSFHFTGSFYIGPKFSRVRAIEWQALRSEATGLFFGSVQFVQKVPIVQTPSFIPASRGRTEVRGLERFERLERFEQVRLSVRLDTVSSFLL
jgi:hypothetical protein